MVFGSHEVTWLVSGLGLRFTFVRLDHALEVFLHPKTSYIIIIINETDLKSSISKRRIMMFPGARNLAVNHLPLGRVLVVETWTSNYKPDGKALVTCQKTSIVMSLIVVFFPRSATSRSFPAFDVVHAVIGLLGRHVLFVTRWFCYLL